MLSLHCKGSSTMANKHELCRNTQLHGFVGSHETPSFSYFAWKHIKTVAQLRSEKTTTAILLVATAPATFSPITWRRGVCVEWNAAGLERIPPGTRAPHGRPHPQRAALRRDAALGWDLGRPWKTLEGHPVDCPWLSKKSQKIRWDWDDHDFRD